MAGRGRNGENMSDMSTVIEPAPDFGTGIYSFQAAARIIRYKHPTATTSTLRRWVRSGLTPASFGRATWDADVLSFQDLISVELVRRFRDEGVSLQRVKKLETTLREERPELERPFAHKLFFVAGSEIWCELFPGDTRAIETVGRRPNQIAWVEGIRTFAEEVRYVGDVATAWELSDWVEIDPEVQFGAPVVKDTRLPIDLIGRELHHATDQQIADWHAVPVVAIRGVADFLGLN